jgi:hypothetical protein
MMNDLLPCPFCGGESEILHYQIDGYLPKCKLCDGMIEKWFLIKEEAIAEWNHRTPIKEARDEGYRS